MSGGGEIGRTFPCFGSTCGAFVTGDGAAGTPQQAVEHVESRLLQWHSQFSRFLRESELSTLNRDPHSEVLVSPVMARFAAAVRAAGSMTGGLVDATLLGEIEDAGYRDSLGTPVPLARALELAPPRRPAAPRSTPGWRRVEVDRSLSIVRRPPGVRLDSGGLAKGLFADVLAEELSGHASFAVSCAGDLAIGGAAAAPRPVNVESPFDGRILHTFAPVAGGVATSGIGRRSWIDEAGRPAHHLLDPSTGRPAFTGIVQVTALAASALEAEIRAKAALLSGPRGASRWLPDGGVVVLEDGSHRVIEPPRRVTLAELSFGGARTPVGIAGAA